MWNVGLWQGRWVLGDAGECWWVLASTGEYWQIPANTGQSLVVFINPNTNSRLVEVVDVSARGST